MSWHDYFVMKMHADARLPELEPRESPCKDVNGGTDCAVYCGLYREIIDALKKEPEGIQNAIRKKWFCHNDPSRACYAAEHER